MSLLICRRPKKNNPVTCRPILNIAAQRHDCSTTNPFPNHLPSLPYQLVTSSTPSRPRGSRSSRVLTHSTILLSEIVHPATSTFSPGIPTLDRGPQQHSSRDFVTRETFRSHGTISILKSPEARSRVTELLPIYLTAKHPRGIRIPHRASDLFLSAQEGWMIGSTLRCNWHCFQDNHSSGFICTTRLHQGR